VLAQTGVPKELLPTEKVVAVRLLQGQKEAFLTRARASTAGRAYPVNKLAADAPVWVVAATSRPLTNLLDGFVPADAEDPFVSVPQDASQEPIEISAPAGGRWKASYDDMLRAAKATPAPTREGLARANGLPASADKLPTWVCVRVPRQERPKDGVLTLTLRPAYPHLCAVMVLTHRLREQVEAARGGLLDPVQQDRLALAVYCSFIGRLRSGLNGGEALKRVQLDSTLAMTEDMPFHSSILNSMLDSQVQLHTEVFLEEYDKQRVRQATAVKEALNQLRQRLSKPADRAGGFRRDYERFLAAAPMFLGLCGKVRSGDAVRIRQRLTPYVRQTLANPAVEVLHGAVLTVVDAFALFSQLERTGRPQKLFDDGELEPWTNWLAAVRGVLLQHHPPAVDGRPAPPSSATPKGAGAGPHVPLDAVKKSRNRSN
jgi:hypothetical protein